MIIPSQSVFSVGEKALCEKVLHTKAFLRHSVLKLEKIVQQGIAG